jgi:hypothetical protein
MRVRYTLRALADLEQIYEYFEKRRPAAALKSMIERQFGWLTNFAPRGDGNSLVQRIAAEQVRELLGPTIRHHQTLAGIHNGRTPCVSSLCSIAIPSIARPQLLAPSE